MPYRALLWTLLTVGLALAGVVLWLGTIEPQLAAAQRVAATQPVTTMRFGKPVVPPEVELKTVAQGTLVLGFVLICMLLVVGLAGASREWIRYRTSVAARRAKPEKTPYVDAWKIAGERMKAKQRPLEEEGDEP